MELKRVVVTGLGALTPIGNTVAEYWEGLVSGKSGAAPIQQFDASLFKTQFACEIKNFNAEEHMDRKEARKLERFSSLEGSFSCKNRLLDLGHAPTSSRTETKALPSAGIEPAANGLKVPN